MRRATTPPTAPIIISRRDSNGSMGAPPASIGPSSMPSPWVKKSSPLTYWVSLMDLETGLVDL